MQIPLSAFEPVGEGLTRPEDAVVSREGRLFASHEDRLAEVMPDGSVRAFGEGLGKCNGINLLPDGRIVTTDYSARGGVRAVDPDTGKVEVLAEEVDGQRLFFTNYPLVDARGAVWVSCSTRQAEWFPAMATGAGDGYVVRIDPDGAIRVVADRLRFANGMAFDDGEAHLYVCQTAPGDVVRLPVLADRTLGAAEPYGPPMGERRPDEYTEEAGMAGFADPAVRRRWSLTDGCGFDAEGNLWVTVVTAGRIAAVTPDGDVVTVADDPDGAVLRLPTNVAWGGDDLTDLYVGTLGAGLLRARSPVPGLALSHQREVH